VQADMARQYPKGRSRFYRAEHENWREDDNVVDAQQTSLSSDDIISRQQVDALDTLINKSDASSRFIPYLYANI